MALAHSRDRPRSSLGETAGHRAHTKVAFPFRLRLYFPVQDTKGASCARDSKRLCCPHPHMHVPVALSHVVGWTVG